MAAALSWVVSDASGGVTHARRMRLESLSNRDRDVRRVEGHPPCAHRLRALTQIRGK
jgi:hypothetical protein